MSKQGNPPAGFGRRAATGPAHPGSVCSALGRLVAQLVLILGPWVVVLWIWRWS